MRTPFSRGLLALGLVLAASCAAPSSSNTGSVQFAVSVPQALSTSDITRVKVTVSAEDMASLAIELAKTHGVWGGIIGNIPTGSQRVFLAEAFDAAGVKRFQGQTSGVTLNANQITAVVLTLQELSPPPPYSNEAPVIDSLVASSTSVQTGGSLSLTATIHDPNAGDTLTSAWAASGGSFSAPTTTSSSWTAPASPGVHMVTFTVTDSQGAAVSVSLTINVVSGTSTGNAALTISFNLWPVVSKVSASLNRLDAGQSTTVSALVADADGDALSYQWTASCPGTWTNATSSAASFVPSSVPAGACNNCKLTVTVQDSRGGQTTGSLNLCVTSPTTERFPPAFSNFFQSATSVSPDQTVDLEVTALDSQASALTFAWSANSGSLATAQNTANTSRVVWTAPSCVITGVTPTLTATVTNAYGLSASKAFSVPGLPTCVSGWSSAGSMAGAREFPTATLLASGKVLVTGGPNAAFAELYDPATNTWSSAGAMASDRYDHTATLLPSGKVLVTGGYGGGHLATAELYDPATNAWSPAGTLATARSQHTATLLPSGKVLVAGGYNGSILSSAEVYDPATNAWSSASSMALSRYYHTAVLLSSGKVLIAGGFSGTYLHSAEVYDPANNSWSSAGSMTVRRSMHTATLLPSGKVLVAAGAGTSGNLASAEVYDPATNAWSSASSMALSRYSHTAVLLSSGKVLIAGGFSLAYLAQAEVYDPATNAWSSTGSMSMARSKPIATLLPSGRVLVTGGLSSSGSLATAELYTP
ncbi:Kelch repeat-containing protein [Hyalangium minutum]|uniref:High-affinity leucine-specific transport system, periplasmic binding protein LivK n=1 Tax=Hyalangium minutum TaxID=394096 RepID=A0A085WCA4_9BACT|nr:kelch repeat-containing protein [Hyalangium minutum]KFE65317.1 High-affinity leucine-specific transport system, periplasmic binding protein LivK [Hyalangium minutum]